VNEGTPECPTLWIRPRRIGRARAYNAYGCRCDGCCEWRRSYDRERWELVRRTAAYQNKEGKRK
jgi:hypothetical protein